MSDRDIHLLATLVGARRLVDQPDAGLDELPAYVQSVKDRMSADGFTMRSSLGAYLVTAYARHLVPTGLAGLRRTPLALPKLKEILNVDGSDVLLGWNGPSDVFAPGAQIDENLLAGLIERSLTPGEREQALNQVAYGVFDSAWAGTACALLHHVRLAMGIWPSDRDPALQAAGVSLRSTDRGRRIQLLEGASSIRGRIAGRLALAEAELAEGRACQPWPDADAEDTGDVETATDENLSTNLGLEGPGLLGLRPKRRPGLSTLDGRELEADVRRHYDAIRGAVLGEAPAAESSLSRRARALAQARSGAWGDAVETLAEEDPEMPWLRARAEVPDAAQEAEIAGRASLLMMDLAASFLYGLSDQGHG